MASIKYEKLKKTGIKDMHNIQLLKACKLNQDLMGEFLLENKEFIFSIILKYKGSFLELKKRFNVEEEEILQLAYIGVISALKDFDFNRGVSFTTFVVRPILWEINEFLYGSSRLIPIGRSSINLVKKIKNVEDTLGYTPDEAELEAILNIPKQKILDVINNTREIKSIHDADDFLQKSNESYTEEKIVNRIYINQLLEKSALTAFEEKIVKLIKYEGLNNSQIAKCLNVYPMTIKRAVAEIGKKINSNGIDERKPTKYHNEITAVAEEMKENSQFISIEAMKQLFTLNGYNIGNYSQRIFYYIRQKAIQILKK